MKEARKQYAIALVGASIGPILQSSALLSDDEKANLDRVLDLYKDAGAIEQVSVCEPLPVRSYDQALDEIIEALKSEVPDSEHKSQCQNCDTVWPDAVLINPIPDLSQRVAPGEPMPSGECPSCGAVCHPNK